MGEQNPSVTDQVAEVVEQVKKAAHEGYSPDPLLLQAARLIATLAAEVERWRTCPPDHFARVWDQPQMSGIHRSPYRQKINEAKDATDALLAEVKRG